MPVNSAFAYLYLILIFAIGIIRFTAEFFKNATKKQYSALIIRGIVTAFDCMIILACCILGNIVKPFEELNHFSKIFNMLHFLSIFILSSLFNIDGYSKEEIEEKLKKRKGNRDGHSKNGKN